MSIKSAGVRILYRQVSILNRMGLPATIAYLERGETAQSDQPDVPVRYLCDPYSISTADLLVIPEGMKNIMQALRSMPNRRFVISLSWSYIYEGLPDGVDWRTTGIERVLTHSPHIAEVVQWAMRLPTHVFGWGVNSELYSYNPMEKSAQITFISRKQLVMPQLQRMLWSRNPDFVEKIRWLGLKGLSESDYAAEIRRSQAFVNLSHSEGLPCSLLEAMRAGAIVAGYNSVGGKHLLIGAGEKRNCILCENLDYPDLARQMEPLLADILAGDMSRWETVRNNSLATSAPFTPEAEEASIVQMWQEIPGL